MEVKTLREAIDEARRFIKAAEMVKIEAVEGTGIARGKKWEIVSWPSRKAAACRRASMDLTNALADLRQNR